MNKICPSCGAESPEKFRFCGFCAHPLDAEPAPVFRPEPPTGQRSSLRLVTVLFADLTNFTGAAERADPESIYHTIRKTLEALSQPVVRLGGHIDRYIGDGFLATFGAPEAHEDDPERALRAALDMQQAMVQLTAEANRKVQWHAQLRIGVHTGPVIRGRLDTGPVADTSVFGHVVNVANRLEGAARPGTILASEAIYRRARSAFNFSEAIRLTLKGIDKPMLGYEVLERRAASHQSSRGLTGRSTPLVGRAAEADQLINVFERLQVDRLGASILITGDAGIGKSRLVQEVLAPVADHATVISTECSPTETGSYSLLKLLLRNLVGIAPDSGPDERQRLVTETLALSPALSQEVGPVLRDILETGEAPGGRIADPRQEQRRLFGAARRLIAWRARQRPLVLVFDDLHWADSSSLDAIAHVVNLVLDAPLVLVAVSRPAPPAPLVRIFNPADSSRPDCFLELRLESLSPADSAELLERLISEVALPPALRQSIQERAAGNPLMLEEIVRMLLDEEIIHPAGGAWTVRPDWAAAVQRVPDTVNGLVLGRYDRLAPKLRRLLDVAAVFRQRFSVTELAAIAHEPEALVSSRVAELESADLIRQVPGTRTPVFAFRHPLMREAIYETILQAERRALHLEAANVIRQLGSGDSQAAVELVAYHLEQGGAPQAGEYLLRAAVRAADRYANAEAIDYYRRLQALYRDQPKSTQAVDAALALGELLLRTSQPEAARTELDRALAAATQPELGNYRLGDLWYRRAMLDADQGSYQAATQAFEKASHILQQEAGQARSYTRADLETELGWIFLHQSQYGAAEEHAALALAKAREAGQLGAAGSAHNLLSVVYFYTGRLQEAVANAVQALSIREQLGDLAGSAITQANLGAHYFRLGEWKPAESYLRQSIFVQQEIGDYSTLALARNTLSVILFCSGRYEEALQLLDQALGEIPGEVGVSPQARYLLMNRGLTWLRYGQPERAEVDAAQSLALAKQLNDDDLRTLALAILAEIDLARGETRRAAARLTEAEALEKATPSANNRAEIWRVRSQLERSRGNWAAALEANQQSAALFAELGDRYEVARSQVQAAELHQAWHAAQADHVIDPACRPAVLEAAQALRKLRAQPDLDRAVALLTTLPGSADAAVASLLAETGRLVNSPGAQPAIQALPGSTARIVGRARELRLLRGWLDSARTGAEGRICYIEAEAGMGKTRLQAEAFAYAAPEITCLLGKCEPFRVNVSFWPFINMLANSPLAEGEAGRRARAVLGLAAPDARDESLLRNASPADLRQEIFARLREFLLDAASRGPALLIIEDIHWLDLSSLDLLDYLIPSLRGAPISIMFTARAEMAGPHRSLLSKAERIAAERYLIIKFAGLDAGDGQAMVRELLGAPALPAGLADWLAIYAGHPLSLEEAVSHLMEIGALERGPDGWTFEADREGGLPRTYRELLLARLDTLDSDSLHVLQAAAVLGEAVDQAVLARVVPGPATPVSLEGLVAHGWLLPAEGGAPGQYRFKHTLTRETIYATLLTSKRRLLHQRTAEALESLHAEALDGQAELLAYHYGRSSQTDRAAHYQLLAAEKSAARQALAESLGYYQEAGEAFQRSPALRRQLGPRLMLGQADVFLALGIPANAISTLTELLNGQGYELTRLQQGAAQQRLAAARRKAGQLNESLQHLEMARAHFKSWSSSQPQMSVADRGQLNRELLLTELGHAQTLFELRQNTRASQQVDYFLSLADRRQNPDLVAQALDLKGGIAYRMRNADVALRLVQDSLSIYQSTGNRAGAAAAYANLGVLNAGSGQVDAALDCFNLSLNLREALGDSQGMSISLNNLAQLLSREGRFAESVGYFNRVTDLARRAGLFQLLGQSLSNGGYALTLDGRPAEGLPLLREAESVSAIHGFRNLLCETLWKRAECLLELDDLAAAESAARAALDSAAELDSHDLRSEAQRVLSRIARRAGRLEIAVRESAEAWELRSPEISPASRARFAAEYGLALKASGQTAKAAPLLHEAAESGYRYASQAYLAEIAEALAPAQP